MMARPGEKAQILSRRNPQPVSASTARLASRLWRDYLGRYWPLLALSLLAMAVYAASASAIPVGVEWINAALVGGSTRFEADLRDAMIWGPVLVLGLGGANALALYFQTRLNLAAALSALRDLQREMFARFVDLDYAQMRAEHSGQTISRFTNDILVLRETLTRAGAALRDALTFVGLCAIMIWYDWALFLIVLVIYPLIGWPIIRIGRYLRRASGEAQSQAGDIAGHIGETVDNARAIKTYGLESYQRRRAEAAFDRRLELLKSIANLRALNEPFIFFVGAVALAIVVSAVAWRISAGALDGPQFVSFILALLLLSQPARGLSTLNAAMQEGFAAFERMIEVIDAQPRVVDRPDARPLVVGAGVVTFSDVRFAYGSAAPALTGFTLEAPAGATTALIGESGAGKSTVFHLLARLYDVDSGTISIDGQNVAGATLASLRAAIAVVSQEPILFNDTIRANIALGRDGASEADIVEAAKAAAIHDFVLSQPDGYDSLVGEGGANISGGQRQRIALARAFLKDAPILLLDEATSALDAESEAKIQEALDRLRKGRTTLVIAHRLSTIIAADLIAVIDRGRVIETGTHRSLTEGSGVYARLAAKQLRAPEPA